MTKTKKKLAPYWKRYYDKHKEHIQEMRRLKRQANKNLLEVPEPFSCRNAGADPNNYKRMFLDDDLKQKADRYNYLEKFYQKKSDGFFKLGKVCFDFVLLMFFFFFISIIFKFDVLLTGLFLFFQLLFAVLQGICLFNHYRNVKKIFALYEYHSHKILDKLRERINENNKKYNHRHSSSYGW